MEPENLEILFNDEKLINFFREIQEKNRKDLISIKEIKNPLWRCFLSNDGSMTKMLSELYEGQIKLDLICSEKILLNKESGKYGHLLVHLLNHLFFKSNFKSQEVILRKIGFKNSDGKLIMIGLSVWDGEIYEKIYTQADDLNKPLGLIIREKQIEYYKEIENKFIYNDSLDTIFIFRSSIYKMNNTMAFIILEIFETGDLTNFFGQFN